MTERSTGHPIAAPDHLAFADEAAFRTWYEATLPWVYGYLLRRTGDAGWAEELTQRTFLDAVQRRASFRGEAEPTTWLIAIARHKLADDLRARSRRERAMPSLRVSADPTEAGHDPLADRAAAVDVQAAVAALPALQRAAVVLVYLDGLPVREAAGLVHKSEKATESLLSRARARLRATLGEAGS